MKLTLQIAPLTKKKQAAVHLVGVYEDGKLTASAAKLDKEHKNIITNTLKLNRNYGKIGQLIPIHAIPNSSDSIFLIGCGNKEKLNKSLFKRIMIQSFKQLNTYNISSAVCYLADIELPEIAITWKIKKFAEYILESQYNFDLFKSLKEDHSNLQEIIIVIPEKSDLKAAKIALAQGEAIAHGVTLTKNLANTPSNICTPTFLADQAKALAKSYQQLSVKILNENEMQKLGMGALLAVSQGSAEEAKLICLEYKGSAKGKAPIALIGKGITFDTGGISHKSPEGMVGMKYDMCGAATVLGVFQAVAELQLPINLVGIIAAVENMPGGTAYKPEDILTSMSGQTIEVISTDAEGRLVLADALTYCERYKPEEVIDIATLTGAVVIALGLHTSGIVSNDDNLAEDLYQAGEEIHDRAWQLPMYDEYQEQIKSPFADISNSGGRSAGAITAGCFLSRFAAKFKWAHLDVAGTAAIMTGGAERLATGRPVPLLMQHLINRSQR